MSAVAGRDSRDVIPRWRPFGSAVRMGELDSTEGIPVMKFQTSVAESVAAFADDPGAFTAGALLSHINTSTACSEAALQAAKFLAYDESAPPAARSISHSILSPKVVEPLDTDPVFDEQTARQRAYLMRSITRSEPLNAIRWIDLALMHVNLGALTKAESEVKIALRLEPDNRHILRSAARFYVLKDDPQRAHALLERSPAAVYDPWLQATELSLSELLDTKNRRIRQARATISQGAFSPLHLSELASELATAEMRAGRRRHAKRTMRTALVNPTENALAQAEWANSQGIDFELDTAPRVPGAFEAQVLESTAKGDMEAALRAGQAWQGDQPFATDAATFTSFIATVGTENWQAGVVAARRGLISSPHDVLLRNNLIFALANYGDLASCEIEIAHLGNVAVGSAEHPTVCATLGLVAFRKGYLDRGRRLYANAIDSFRAINDLERERVAIVLLAREELLARTEEASVAFKRAQVACRESQEGQLLLWWRRVQALQAKQGS